MKVIAHKKGMKNCGPSKGSSKTDKLDDFDEKYIKSDLFWMIIYF